MLNPLTLNLADCGPRTRCKGGFPSSFASRGWDIIYIYDIHMSHIQYMKIYNTFFISTHIYMSMVKKMII